MEKVLLSCSCSQTVSPASVLKIESNQIAAHCAQPLRASRPYDFPDPPVCLAFIS